MEGKVSIWIDKGCYEIGEKINVHITILNLNDNPLRLNFHSSQRYDFIIFKEHREVWRWSTGKMFAMFLNSITVNPHEKEVFAETLDPRLSKGEYRLVGVVTSKPPYKISCSFRIK